MTKIDIKQTITPKTPEKLLNKDLRTVKRMCKNSAIPSKDQTQDSWALKKDKRYKPTGYVLYSKK
jgi:hypothetical protein